MRSKAYRPGSRLGVNRVHGHAGNRRLGRSATPTYQSWRAMKERCSNPKNQAWHHYGGRGVIVCDRWLGADGFAHFLADMGERPDGRTLDRIDPYGNYEPSNCRWATTKEQRANQRPHSFVKRTAKTGDRFAHWALLEDAHGTQDRVAAICDCGTIRYLTLGTLLVAAGRGGACDRWCPSRQEEKR